LNKLSYQIPQAVEVTGLGRTTIYNAIKANALKAFRVGGRRLIAHDDLIEFLDRHKEASQ
jgi:excisionase family DNA binding protein